MTLEDSITELHGVGPAVARKLRKLGIESVGDLLHYLPIAYDDYRTQHLVAKAPTGVTLMLEGVLTTAVNRRSWHNRKLHVTECIFQDKSGALKVVWFGRFPRKVPTDIPVRLFGVIENEKGSRQMTNPLVERVEVVSYMAGKLVPRYALTQGLSQYHLRVFVVEALRAVVPKEWYPPSFLRENKLIELSEALPAIHFPSSETGLALAKHRLGFDEVFFVQLARAIARRERAKRPAPSLSANIDDLVATLPFPLTPDQTRALEEIWSDMAKAHPMARLLQGEVGSGKTVVAALAAAVAARAGYASLYLAPTEILARQQYEGLKKFLGDSMQIALLTSSAAIVGDDVQKRPELLRALKQGKVDVLIGTHALLQSDVEVPKLGFVVVDEQHRFGVGQRLLAERKGKQLVPHLLSMTATPIPRTLQLAFFGDLDISNLKTMPHGRRRVKTMLFAPRDRKRVEVAIRRRIAKGEQVFVVCPLIDPSDMLGVRSATEEYERLRKGGFAPARIGLLHGKMKSEEKNKVLEAFREHTLDMLVATTVIEVGIDIPEATVLVIEGAERFGLAQLHQLRGRVGRSGKEGVCVLFPTKADAASERLQAFVDTDDGFMLAELDLKFRGPGEWFGARQSGFEEFRVADINDEALRASAEDAAKRLLESDPELKYSPGIFYRVTELQLKLHHAS